LHFQVFIELNILGAMKICEDDQKCWWRLATIKKENAGGEIVNFLFLKQYNITLLLRYTFAQFMHSLGIEHQDHWFNSK